VKDCWSHVKASALAKHQEFEILVADNIEVFADVNMLNTIIRNLLQNAVKFTPKNGKISISAFESTSGITVAVEDSGIGMSAQDIEKLFRIDVKFSTPGTSKEPGTGLGLLLCKEFVEKHKGQIWVTSTEGSGSKFYFSIPVKS
jgi:signal transduction histidine kinase